MAEKPQPNPTADQVVVAVAGAGINRTDLIQVMGGYPAPAGWPPDIPGLEFAGTVSAIGPAVGAFEPGDRVFGIVGGGGHAEYVLTHEALCARVPEKLDLVEAGGVPEVFITAHDAMVTQAGLKPGERVLIHAVGSGVGTAAVQIAHAMGAESVGTARTPDKLERALQLGLDTAVEAGEGMVDKIGEVDVVIDLVGGPYIDVDVAACRPRGRIILVGLLGGAQADLDLGALLRKRLVLRGTVLRSRPEWEKAQATAAFAQQILPLFDRGLLRPVIDEIIPLDEGPRGYGLIRSNKTFGKLVLAP